MSYELRTLIVFDTNSLRSTEEGQVAYSFFAFGKPFQLIEEYITANRLSENVKLAIPDWAITEIKDQKRRQYLIDVDDYKKLAKRLSGLPHTGEITFPEVEFDCAQFIEEKAADFIASKTIIKLELPDDIGSSVLKSMMARVIRDNKAPFANLGKSYKDAGFKDNIVWESLMHYNGIRDFDKIIFLTKDGDFNNHCKDEFKEKWGKFLAIEKEETNVVAVLGRDYKNYIENRTVYDYARKEYFDDYLKDSLNAASTVFINNVEYRLTGFEIEKHCTGVEVLTDEEGDFVSPVIVSLIKVYYEDNGTLQGVKAIAKTQLSDYETMEIEKTDFDPNIF